MQKYMNTIIDAQGHPVGGSAVLVTPLNSVIPAALYSDNGITALTNPLVTDSLGRFAFYAADGHYSLTVSAAGASTYTLTDILLDDTAGQGGGTRPTSPNLYDSWFDTAIGQPVWCTSVSPVTWVNSAGVIV